MAEATWAARALVVEGGHRGFGHLLTLFNGAGIECTVVQRSEGLEAFERRRPDLVLLDVAPPIDEAKRILAAVQEEAEPVPVLALSSRDESEAAKALRMGADDFLHEDFGDDEVIARVEALLRRSSERTAADAVLADDLIELDLQSQRVSVLGGEVLLAPTEFRLLVAFLRHPGEALSHSQLLEMVWDDGHRANDEVKLYVSYLRRKLRAAAEVDPIETLRGVGYRYRPHPIPQAAD
jgi:DNA-binding response OmpR family regulator